MDDSIGLRLRVRREELGWTRGQLETLTGISASSIEAVERGITQNPGAITLKLLATALGLDLDDLVPPVELPAIPKPGERLELTSRRQQRSRGRLTVGSENPIGGGATAARLTVNQHSAEREAA